MSAPRLAVAAIALAAVGTIVLAQGDQTGTLRGHVSDRSQERPVAGIDVTLSWTERGTPESRTVTTDSDGAYVFYDLPLADEVSFDLSAVVKGKTLERKGVALSTWTPEMVADLEHVDTSGDPSHVHVGRMSVMLPPSPEAGILNVLEFVQIHNDSETAFAKPDSTGREIGYRLNVPDAAQQVSVQGNDIETSVEGSLILLTQALAPGHTDLTLSYVVPDGSSLDLSRHVHYPIEDVVVLIGADSFELTSSGFNPGETASIHGEEYATLQRQQIEADTHLDLTFRKAALARPSGAGAAAAGDVPILPATLVVLLAIGTGGAIGLWIGQSRRRGSAAESGGTPDGHGTNGTGLIATSMLKRATGDELASLKELHLGFIADLDDRHRTGRLPTAVYHQLRGEHKARLGQVIEQLESK
jgi:hypothetical protein